jgi:hypothetical protein
MDDGGGIRLQRGSFFLFLLKRVDVWRDAKHEQNTAAYVMRCAVPEIVSVRSATGAR